MATGQPTTAGAARARLGSNGNPGLAPPLSLVALALLAALCLGCGDERELTIAYTGSTDGVIWPCMGCAEEPSGGLARRATAMRRLRESEPDLLLVDSGDLLSARGRPVGDRKVLELYRLLEYDAVNVGDQEFINGPGFFRDEVLAAGLPLVSANLFDVRTGDLLVAPYVIREKAGLRVALVGLVDAQAFMVLSPELYEGIGTGSLAEAVAAVVPELRDRADLLVVLSNLGSEGDRDLAEEVPEIDVIVGGHSGGELAEPLRIGQTLIVRPGHGGRLLGRLDLVVDGQGRIAEYSHDLLSLPESVPEAPDLVAAVVGVAPWEAGSQKEMVPSVHTGRLYTESVRCAGCHPEAMGTWRAHGHARAFESLPVGLRGNLGCLPCHATGWAKGGYIDESRTPQLKHVGCTSCHVMRRKHLSWPDRSPVPTVGDEDCRRCHTDEWTPEFSFEAYWARIEH